MLDEPMAESQIKKGGGSPCPYTIRKIMPIAHPMQTSGEQTVEPVMDLYRTYSRTADKALSTFAIEMSDILRQSIQRLDTISCKVRSCVYDLDDHKPTLINENNNVQDMKTETKPVDVVEKPQQKRRKNGKFKRRKILNRKDSGLLQKKDKDVMNGGDCNEVESQSRIYKDIPLNSNNKSSDKLFEEIPEYKKTDFDRRGRKRRRREIILSKELFRGAEDNSQPPAKSQKVNAAYTEENYNDNNWFGPKLLVKVSKQASDNIVGKLNRKIISRLSARSSRTFKNVKLSRKYALENIHDTTIRRIPKLNENICGERVKLTSDGKQDFCIMMHTPKPAAKYELKQNSPFATNNILDEITLKDLEPIKAEYPRKDHLVEPEGQFDNLLHRLVANENLSSLQYLVRVDSNTSATSKRRLVRYPSSQQNMEYLSFIRYPGVEDIAEEDDDVVTVVDQDKMINASRYEEKFATNNKYQMVDVKKKLKSYLIDPVRKIPSKKFIVMPVLVKFEKDIQPHMDSSTTSLHHKEAVKRQKSIYTSSREHRNPNDILKQYIFDRIETMHPVSPADVPVKDIEICPRNTAITTPTVMMARIRNEHLLEADLQHEKSLNKRSPKSTRNRLSVKSPSFIVRTKKEDWSKEDRRKSRPDVFERLTSRKSPRSIPATRRKSTESLRNSPRPDDKRKTIGSIERHVTHIIQKLGHDKINQKMEVAEKIVHESTTGVSPVQSTRPKSPVSARTSVAERPSCAVPISARNVADSKSVIANKLRRPQINAMTQKIINKWNMLENPSKADSFSRASSKSLARKLDPSTNQTPDLTLSAETKMINENLIELHMSTTPPSSSVSEEDTQFCNIKVTNKPRRDKGSRPGTPYKKKSQEKKNDAPLMELERKLQEETAEFVAEMEHVLDKLTDTNLMKKTKSYNDQFPATKEAHLNAFKEAIKQYNKEEKTSKYMIYLDNLSKESSKNVQQLTRIHHIKYKAPITCYPLVELKYARSIATSSQHSSLSDVESKNNSLESTFKLSDFPADILSYALRKTPIPRQSSFRQLYVAKQTMKPSNEHVKEDGKTEISYRNTRSHILKIIYTAVFATIFVGLNLQQSCA